LSAARNWGLNAADEDYVFFMDSDDWLLPGSLEKITSQLDGEDVLYFNAIKYYEETASYGKELDIPILRNKNGSEYFTSVYDKPRNMPIVCVCGGVYKRSFLLKNNLYNEPGIYHEDNYFTPQVLLKAQKVSSINEYVYAYRIREGSITANVKPKHIHDMLYVARNLFAKYEANGDVADIFYWDICNIYSNLINAAYDHSIPLKSLWSKADSKRMVHCASNSRSRKIAKLSFFSPCMAYRYMHDNLPNFVRRIINRFL
jgi:glycosyltransferase involved in cell wall biosynthesis